MNNTKNKNSLFNITHIKNSNNFKYYDIIDEQVNNKYQKYNVFIPNLCNTQPNLINQFSKSLYEKYPIALANYEMISKRTLGTNQIVQVFQNKNYGCGIYVCNMIVCDGRKSKDNRTLNYYALARCMHQTINFINQNLSQNDSVKSKIYWNKQSMSYTGANWSIVECLIDDVWKNLDTYIYD